MSVDNPIRKGSLSQLRSNPVSRNADLLQRENSNSTLKAGLKNSPSAAFRSVPRQGHESPFQRKSLNNVATYYQEISKNPRARQSIEKYQALFGRKGDDSGNIPASRLNEIDDMEDDNERPGPGSYTGLYSNSSFSSLKKERFQ